MTVHPLRTAQAHCDHCGSFIKANATECRRCRSLAAHQAEVGQRPTGRPRLSLVKTPTVPPLTLITSPTVNLTKAPRALPARPRINDLTIAEIAAGRAAMAARVAGIPVRVMDWHGHHNGTATILLDGGLVLRYQPTAPRPFAASVPCLGGAHHYYQVAGPTDLTYARADADCCRTLHADFTDWATAAAKDLSAAFAPRRIPGITPVLTLAHKPFPGGEQQ